MNKEFTSFTHELGITHAPRMAHFLWTNGKVESQNLGKHY